MPLSHEDFTEIKKVMDDRYVLQSECTDRQKTINTKLSNDDKRIELVMHDFATIKKLIWIVATSAIGQVVLDVMNIMQR